MRFNSFSYRTQEDNNTGWNIRKIDFMGVNLLVGASGSGKSTVLKTMFELGKDVARGSNPFVGFWDVELLCGEEKYCYQLERSVVKKDEAPTGKNLIVKSEKLTKDGLETPIIDRNTEHFSFNGAKLPKLAADQNGISLLKDEELVEPVFSGFTKMKRREFDGGALQDNREFKSFNHQFVNNLKPESINDLPRVEYTLNQSLFLLHKYFPDIYNDIKDTYCSIFPEVSDLDIQIISISSDEFIPVIEFKDKATSSKAPISELSSGMLKVMLILVDIQFLPEDSIYIIDEYENSLGINAINFFPDYLIEFGSNKQFFVTTHHPYIINNIPIENWILLTRKGLEISTIRGEVLKEKYGKSSQSAFIKLINDPLYFG